MTQAITKINNYLNYQYSRGLYDRILILVIKKLYYDRLDLKKDATFVIIHCYNFIKSVQKAIVSYIIPTYLKNCIKHNFFTWNRSLRDLSFDKPFFLSHGKGIFKTLQHTL